MKVHATGSIKEALPTQYGWDVVKVASKSNPSKLYTVDVTHGRCDCPAWVHARAVNGLKPPCKHLRSLGFVPAQPIRQQEQLPLGLEVTTDDLPELL